MNTVLLIPSTEYNQLLLEIDCLKNITDSLKNENDSLKKIIESSKTENESLKNSNHKSKSDADRYTSILGDNSLTSRLQGVVSEIEQLKLISDDPEKNNEKLSKIILMLFNINILEHHNGFILKDYLRMIRTDNVTSLYHIFAGRNHLKTLEGLSEWNVSNVTDFHEIFPGCWSLKNIEALSHWKSQVAPILCICFNHVMC